VSWIKNCAMALVKKGDLLTLLGWQRQFSMVHIPTELKIAIAWGMALAVRIEDVLQLLSQIESDLGNNTSAKNASLACECATIRSVVIALADDSQAAL
jgi:LuxR family maltose regulon positive regulatory protein